MRSELDELEEEIKRRTKEEELRRKKLRDKEAAMVFNPRPSKFMDLDELQNQGEWFLATWCVTCNITFI